MNLPKILIVDDSSIIRKALSRQLEKFGARVTQAEDGLQGLEQALSGSFDLVISDVEMPHLDGFGLCAQLKDHPATRGIPVIILSSLDSDRDVEQGFNVGASAYVSKSEAQIHLNETIERVLEKSKFHHSRLVLVVDDSQNIRQRVTQALEEAGFQVLEAEDGKKALKRIGERRPDLILSDLDMPQMNGFDLCRKLHGDPDLGTIPFVVMSSNNDRAVMRQLLQWGAAGYLVKPFNLEQVVITVEKLISDHFLLLLKERERLDLEQKMMLAGITSLIVALEARDHYTRGHSEAVALLVTRMAAHMNAGPEEIESLGISGRLHDIGKIGIPDSILLKPGRLSDEEFTIIKKHPVIGASILGSIPSIKPLLPVILHHHERFDGSGYPDGIKGEKILRWARMTAVADTYDALTSDRPYRRALSQDRAMEIIEEERGRQLCPECVEALMSLMRDIRRNFSDEKPALIVFPEGPTAGSREAPAHGTSAALRR